MMPLPAMDLFAGELARDAGLVQAAASRNELVNKIREYLMVLARNRPNRIATADDYESFLRSLGMSNKDLGNAAGVIFKTPEWEFTGVWTPSKRKTNNARAIRVWRLK
ncbi:MAG TPA: hypothetical protein VGC07_08085 [Granulicella sp.]